MFDLCAHRGPDWGPLALTPLCPLALILGSKFRVKNEVKALLKVTHA